MTPSQYNNTYCVIVAGVAQLVRAPVCGTGCRRFKSGHSPHFFVPAAHFLIDVSTPNQVADVLTNTAVICCVDTCGRGEIGRRARFRFWYLTMWGFKSLRPHHQPHNRYLSRPFVQACDAIARDLIIRLMTGINL